MQGGIRADQSISFQSMQKKFMQFANVAGRRSGGGAASAALPAAAAPAIPATCS